MLRVEEAQDKILAMAPQLRSEMVPLVDAIGRVLSIDVLSDNDSPPHDKSLMDGFALSTRCFSGPGTELRVIETVTAGEVPRQSLGPGEAVRIMTGAVVPDQADAVVMFEETNSTGDRVEIRAATVSAEQNILRRGTVMRRDDIVLRQGRSLRPMEIGLLGEVGCDPVPCARRPELAVLATGNELVDARDIPPTGAIRNSNGPMIASFAADQGAVVRNLGIGRDNEADLKRLIGDGLQSDVLVISGGVSAGDLDLIPKTLAGLGVECLFHGVQLKPGKPIWVGHRQPSDPSRAKTTLVFGLPGNPVSSLVCFHLFVAPALRKMAGHAAVRPLRFSGRMQHGWSHPSGRPTYFPGIAEPSNGGLDVRLCPWKGSADQRSLVDANALVLFPDHPVEYEPGSIVEFEWIR